MRNKYGAIKTKVDGYTFDSKAEASRYLALVLLQRAGEISELEVQPPFQLKCGGKPVLIRSEGYPNGRVAKYVGDFAYVDHAGHRVVEDVKGKDLPLSRLKRALVEAEYGVVVKVVR